jgi:hypothetical protein
MQGEPDQRVDVLARLRVSRQPSSEQLRIAAARASPRVTAEVDLGRQVKTRPTSQSHPGPATWALSGGRQGGYARSCSDARATLT